VFEEIQVRELDHLVFPKNRPLEGGPRDVPWEENAGQENDHRSDHREANGDRGARLPEGAPVLRPVESAGDPPMPGEAPEEGIVDGLGHRDALQATHPAESHDRIELPPRRFVGCQAGKQVGLFLKRQFPVNIEIEGVLQRTVRRAGLGA
jgi:hypothetical protein